MVVALLVAAVFGASSCDDPETYRLPKSRVEIVVNHEPGRWTNAYGRLEGQDRSYCHHWSWDHWPKDDTVYFVPADGEALQKIELVTCHDGDFKSEGTLEFGKGGANSPIMMDLAFVAAAGEPCPDWTTDIKQRNSEQQAQQSCRSEGDE